MANIFNGKVEIPSNFFPRNQTAVGRGDKEKILQRYGNAQFLQQKSLMSMVSMTLQIDLSLQME
jgi:hypothetical protein